jgi:CDP-paratose 2-epimerase
MSKRVLVTGGAGFVGSSLALRLKRQHLGWQVLALDNLRRRGSELSLPRLREGGVEFLHGDVRIAEDLREAAPVDLILECSAEPSVLAGLHSSPAYVIQTNLAGTINCLELARQHEAAVIFLSTSRVYPIALLADIAYKESETRFEIVADAGAVPGLSAEGIAEQFPLAGARSIYGASKLCSELLIQEYVDAFGLPILIDRCGVITGPWQMGKVDQGVVVHWILCHLFERPLTYIGFGGTGKQVRDILHIEDLGRLLEAQIPAVESHRGQIFNVGGGRQCSVSLRELTELCVRATGKRIPVGSQPETRPADIPIYLTDIGRVRTTFGWQPSFTAGQVVEETTGWIREHREALARTLGLA